MVPSVFRVAAYTVTITFAIIGLFWLGGGVYEGEELDATAPLGMADAAALFTLMIPGNFLFDYFNFLKTRLVLEFVAKHLTFISIVFGMFVEIITFIGLYIVTNLITGVMAFLMSFAYLLMLHSGTVFEVSLDSTITTTELVKYINAITAFLSTIIVILFVVATMLSYFANNISVIQQFLDRHTAVLDNPIQTLGAMVVVLFTVLFWIWFGIHQLVGPH
jgi:hypothetical protein